MELLPKLCKRDVPPPSNYLHKSDQNPADFQVFLLKIGNGLNGAFSQWLYTWGEKNSSSRSMPWKGVKKGQTQFKVIAEHNGTDENLDR